MASKAGRPLNKARLYEIIILREKKNKSWAEIGRILGITRQDVHRYYKKKDHYLAKIDQ
jgi:predicted transcriptional regulator